MLDKFLHRKRNIFGVQIADWLLVVVALAVFTAISIWNITGASIWFDEAFGAYLSQFNFIDIARYTASDVHPPMYYWLLKLWAMLFGNTDLAMRSMSVLFGGVAIVFGYLLTNRLFSRNIARVSLILMAVSPMLIRYSREMRMYTLVTAIAMAATYILVIAMESKKKLPWVIYGILVALGMWTHYFTALIWIAHWIWRADIIRRIAGKGKFIKQFFSKQWLMSHIIAVAVFVPWLPFMAIQFATVQASGFWIAPITPDTVINFMTNVVFYQDIGEVNNWLAIGFIVLIVAVSIMAVIVYKKQNQQQRQNYRLVMALAFIPVVILTVLSLPPLRPAFVDRYLIPSTLSIVLFMAVTIGFAMKSFRPRLRILFVLPVISMFVIGITNVWYLGNYNKTDGSTTSTHQFVQDISEKYSGQPIIASTPWLFYEASFYSTDKTPVYFIDAKIEYRYGSLKMLQENDQFKIKDMDKFVANNPVFWYVGVTRTGDFAIPYANWEKITELNYTDPINGKSSYKAIQFKSN